MEDNTMDIGIVNFEKGKRYANRKGDFEVISISGNNMTIRWDSGQTVDTPIELQARIIANMASEKRTREAKPAKKKASSKAKVDANFLGLTETDFSKKVTGTTWRNRSCLGGLVTNTIKPEGYLFHSHAVYRKSGIFWQDDNHRDKEKIDLQAKFFVQLDEEELCCGYSVECSNKEADEKRDWDGFINWLKTEDNESWLKNCVSENSFVISSCLSIDKMSKIDILSSVDDQWVHEKNEDKTEYASLTDYVDSISKGTWLNIQVVKKMSKNDVVETGLEIANDISKVFNILMPLYHASVAGVASVDEEVSVDGEA